MAACWPHTDTIVQASSTGIPWNRLESLVYFLFFTDRWSLDFCIQTLCIYILWAPVDPLTNGLFMYLVVIFTTFEVVCFSDFSATLLARILLLSKYILRIRVYLYTTCVHNFTIYISENPWISRSLYEKTAYKLYGVPSSLLTSSILLTHTCLGPLSTWDQLVVEIR